jgi:hypothetical protein
MKQVFPMFCNPTLPYLDDFLKTSYILSSLISFSDLPEIATFFTYELPFFSSSDPSDSVSLSYPSTLNTNSSFFGASTISMSVSAKSTSWSFLCKSSGPLLIKFALISTEV